MANLDGRPTMGLPTGFRRLDDMTRGLHPGDFNIIAARPSMGKTALALDVVRNVAMRGNKDPVAVFSLEMTKESLVNRMACAEARVDSHRWRAGFLDKNDLRAIGDAYGKISESPIYIDDTSGLSLYELQAKAKRLVARYGVKLIVIDYIQLMSPPKAENRNLELGMISRGLKMLFGQLLVSSLVLAQLSRGPEGRARGQNHRPMLGDLRESGNLENDADLVAMLYREEYYLKMHGREITADVEGRAEVIIGKQRQGPTGTVNLVFLDKYSSFGDPAEEWFEK
jgi:replicative DNA helicase